MKFGTDHYIHLGYINQFKMEGKKYGDILVSHFNQRYFVYPVFFHYLLANFFYSSIRNPKLINYGINLISIIFLNLFLLRLLGPQDLVFIIKINFISLIFPFSYVNWNAKNSGLSVRSFGLLLGQLFTYCLVLYINDGLKIWFLFMVLFSFLSLISSQFAFQYLVFISIVISAILLKLELLIPFLISIALFFIFFPKLSVQYFKGQYSHK